MSNHPPIHPTQAETPAGKRIRQLADVRSLLLELSDPALRATFDSLDITSWTNGHAQVLTRIIEELKAEGGGQ